VLGWFSSISRNLKAPIGLLDRTLGTHKSATRLPSDSAQPDAPASTLGEASAARNDDKPHEWQTRGVGKSATRWNAVVDRRAVPEWQSAREGQPVPEWKTDVWKRRVEGEAKKHFDGEITGVGRIRS